ncbi:BnaA07g08590D [Brassica napus]|uniref:BnaA07g08590D protein n=2 Tax=Brassica TaxID=3705 RepID=A0A078FTN4_BRANA|nr:BnaA07g08590D [Brassica napus]
MSCRGSGVVEATNTAAVVIPEGFSVNFMLLVGSEAMVVIQVKPLGTCISNLRFLMIRHSPEMAQEIYGDANISFTQAILGGKVVVSTSSGKTEIEVRSIIYFPGELLVLRGKGLYKQGYFCYSVLTLFILN